MIMQPMGPAARTAARCALPAFARQLRAATQCGTVSRPREAAYLAPHHAALLRQACHAPPPPWAGGAR
jgi:hypothetical protein